MSGRGLALRWRLSLTFAGVMAVILGLTGLFVYVQLRENLDDGITEGLRSRVDAVARLASSATVAQPRPALDPDADSAAQIVGAGGRVLLSSPRALTEPLVDADTLRAALVREQVVERPGPNGDSFRVLAVAAGRGRVALVADSLEDRRDEPLRLVGGLLLIGLPIALLLATAAGYRVVRGALRPVERMRQEAERITAGPVAQRLPVPPGDDELARLGATLNAMLARIQAALARQRAFVADAAHELRTPLAILAAETELTLRHAASVGEYRDALHSNQEEIERLSTLSEELLTLARADSEPVSAPDLVGVEVAPVLVRIVALFATAAARESRDIVVEPSPPGLRVTVERGALERALTVLLDNALRYGAGSTVISATVIGQAGPKREVDRDGRNTNQVKLEVRDHGAGIDPALLGTVFERFTRADTARGPGGTGLGLALVAATAERAGGKAGAAAAPGGGALVWLTLPQAGEYAAT